MTTTTERLNPKDTVELLQTQYSFDPRKGKQRVADKGEVFSVNYVVNEEVCLKSGKQQIWVPLADVKLIERYVTPEEIIAPIEQTVFEQFNGKPQGLWELVKAISQPAPVVRGALNGLVRQGLVEEVELDVWRKVDNDKPSEQENTAGDNRKEEQDSTSDSTTARNLPSHLGKSTSTGHERIEEEPLAANGNRGTDSLKSERAVVSGEERPSWAVEAEEELNHIQGQIDNCSIEKATTTDSKLKKSLFEAYKTNQQLFRESVQRYSQIAADMGYSFGFQSEKIDKRYNRIVVYTKPVEVCRVKNPESKLGEILNLASQGEASVIKAPQPTLSELEAEADRLWELRSQLEGQLLHCLAEIYLGGEWRQSYKTWTQYFIATFSHWQKAHRYRMKDAGEIFSQFLQLSPQGDASNNVIPLPTSEGQLRELKSLPAPKRVEVWQQVVEEHGAAPPRTAVAQVVKKYKVESQQSVIVQAQAKTEQEIAAQFNCIVGDPVRVTYTGRARGLESDVAPQHDGLIGVVQHLGVASGLVYIPILSLNIRCTPSQMVAVPLPSESRNICDRITRLMTNARELSPMMRGAIEALSRQLEYSEDDMWLLSQIEERLIPHDLNPSSVD